MKLALLRQRYTPFGGAERFVERAVGALTGLGVNVTVVARRWQGSAPVPVERCDPFYIGKIWRDAGFAHAALSLAQRGGYDLVQSHERIPGCTLYRAGDGVHRVWLAQRARVQSAARRLAVCLDPYHRYVLGAERAMFLHPNLHAVICNSKMVQAEIQECFALPADKLPVIYNGIDPAVFHPGLRAEFRSRQRAALGTDAQATVYLLVGAGFQRKGVATALRAYAELDHAAELWIIGHDRRLHSYQALAHQLLGARANGVRFLGALRDVRPYYGAADVFVLPTLYDPFPNAALEAMACGLAPLLSSKCGASELLRHGESGYVADALDIPAFAAGMRALADPADAARVGQAAHAAVRHLTLEHMAAQLSQFYRGLLGA